MPIFKNTHVVLKVYVVGTQNLAQDMSDKMHN